MTRETRVLIGDYTPSPKLSTDGDRWAVVAATAEGVKIVLGTMADLTEKEPDMSEPTKTRVAKIDTVVTDDTLRATATVEGPWDWLIWTVVATNGEVAALKVDDRQTTITGLAPGVYSITAEAVSRTASKTVSATITTLVEPVKPALPALHIGVTIPSPGSDGTSVMLDRARLQALRDIGIQGCRYNLHYRRSEVSVEDQVRLYSEYWHVRDHMPIIDWSKAGTSPDAGVDPDEVKAFALWAAKRYGFEFVELGNEVWQHDSPTSEYFRVAVPVAQALLSQTTCKIGICCDYADYGRGKRRPLVDLEGLQGFLDDDPSRLVACVHPYPQPASNRIEMGEIQRVFQPSLVYATEWGVKNDDVAGLIAGLDDLRTCDVPLVSLYVYDDGPPDFMGLLKAGHVRTATGEALASYIAQMRKDHGRETPPDPVVQPDPPQALVYPTRDEYRAFRGNFLASEEES